MASSVEKRTALALPVFKIERFAGVTPIRSDNSVSVILRRAKTISSLTFIPICVVCYDSNTKITIFFIFSKFYALLKYCSEVSQKLFSLPTILLFRAKITTFAADLQTKIMGQKALYNFSVLTENVDLTLHATIESLCANMFAVAGMDARKNGISADTLMQQGRSWVLSRMSVEFDRMPEQFENFNIATWINPHTSRLLSTRNFELLDTEGTIFGRGVSQWCVIDFEKRMPVSLEEIESLIDPSYPCDEPSPCDPPRKVRGIVPTVARKREVVYSDIDFNRHVNTMRYIRMMLNTLPIEYLTENRPLRLDIHFANECKLGQTLTINYEQRENVSMFEIRNDEAVACTAAIEWR